ncbi:hypothetical protein PRIPAC_97082 [Pristionchus pacificus]|uniref:Ankyrin repeat-containing protein n=1 Tax=Pristionchus pacificus TaxID=54126 RepID=A0A454XX40_PRIPA|nr:hypothetical protein PRIPAC_97082 [Pristionchus pacificus]|eukprot:PDM84449.1 Ankyrin repeat-containing protein [Pristionchus pacificus]
MLILSRRRGKSNEDESANSLHDLDVAIQNNRVDLVRQVLANREKNSEASKASALHKAVRNSNIEIAHFLISRGADPNRTATDDGKLETPLGTAVRMHNDEIVRLLLKCGASPNLADQWSRTPLYQAVFYSSFNQARMLIENGANVHAADRQGHTPLHIACRTHGNHDNHRLVSLLLNHGANPNRSTVGGLLPIDLAVQKSDHNTVDMLLEAGSIEGMDARTLMNDIDNETDPIRKMLLQKDACYLAIMKHRTRKVQSLSTIAMRRLRNLLILNERRSGRSIILTARALPIPEDLLKSCEYFIGPNSEC